MPEDTHRRQPARFLIYNLGLLPRGRALDIAMGYGENAVFLASNGFQVEGVDISGEAVAGALEAARRAGVTIAATVADLGKDYVAPGNTYDVIIVFYYLQRSLIPSLKAALKEGGTIVYETFIIDQARFGRPSNPEHLLQHNELLHLFRDFRCLRYREGLVKEGKAVASIVAQKTRHPFGT